MFGTDFDEKCIIMHFLGIKKTRESLNAEAQRTQSKIEEALGGRFFQVGRGLEWTRNGHRLKPMLP
jgi:hypothetical protein